MKGLTAKKERKDGRHARKAYYSRGREGQVPTFHGAEAWERQQIISVAPEDTEIKRSRIHGQVLTASQTSVLHADGGVP
jgi:hypothetical protein